MVGEIWEGLDRKVGLVGELFGEGSIAFEHFVKEYD